MTSRRSTATVATAATQLELPWTAPVSGAVGGARRARRGATPASRRGPARRAPEASGPRPVTDDGSRLDEQTRRIGRQGIAAARALLAATDAELAATDADDGRSRPADRRGAPGCAA